MTAHSNNSSNNGCRCPEVEIEVYDYDGYVYNLAVNEDESYVAEGIAVHNCRCPENFEYGINPEYEGEGIIG